MRTIRLRVPSRVEFSLWRRLADECIRNYERRMDNLTMTNCKNCAAPLEALPVCEYCHTTYINVVSDVPVSWFYDTRYIGEEQARHFGNPRKIIPVHVPDGLTISDIIVGIPITDTFKEIQ